MTTIIAVLSGYVFYSNEAWIPLAIVAVAGFGQYATKAMMNSQFQIALAEGYTGKDAWDKISYRLTQGNMLLSLVVFSLAIYALFIFFS